MHRAWQTRPVCIILTISERTFLSMERQKTVQEDLIFLFNIIPIRIKDNWPEMRLDSQNHWYPPFKKAAFEVDLSLWYSNLWIRWEQGNIQLLGPGIDLLSGGAQIRCCSMFFDFERNFYVVAPYNCLATDVDQDDDYNIYNMPWRRINFEHKETSLPSGGRGRPLSCLAFAPATRFHLHSAPHPAWIPQLLPDTYRSESPGSTFRTGLAGELTILLGLAAFSCEPIKVIDTIRDSLRLPVWQPHGSQPILRESFSFRLPWLWPTD